MRPKAGQTSGAQRPELFDYDRNKSEIMLESPFLEPLEEGRTGEWPLPSFAT